MSQATDVVRIGFELDRETNNRIDVVLPWGTKSECFRALALLLAQGLETHGIGLITLLSEDRLELKLKRNQDVKS